LITNLPHPAPAAPVDVIPPERPRWADRPRPHRLPNTRTS